eukprot:CAMPEP_0201476014 /NCGR_PEP_ID=MMETSP0151_2-20130828/1313_1 /ASSEMBLY_ACC=CAM_ASM_000257 /TAXON_ID=200890 /ORGANISM="Paramoeba atlantica, Strain 621/1 / CCAP 1560/9" /LENGTH=313 /DNA_ID=CAMNT_0047856271 /DNA_START=957 /DNA_END=1898 /DNA_ORIENTATION=-
MSIDADNGTLYRQKLEKLKPPYLAFVGLHFKDLTYINDANPDFIEEKVNFSKFCRIGTPLLLILKGISKPLTTEPNDLIQHWMCLSLPKLSDNEIFWWSKRVEPKNIEVAIGDFIKQEIELSRDLESQDKKVEELEQIIQCLQREKREMIEERRERRGILLNLMERVERLEEREEVKKRELESEKRGEEGEGEEEKEGEGEREEEKEAFSFLRDSSSLISLSTEGIERRRKRKESRIKKMPARLSHVLNRELAILEEREEEERDEEIEEERNREEREEEEGKEEIEKKREEKEREKDRRKERGDLENNSSPKK